MRHLSDTIESNKDSKEKVAEITLDEGESLISDLATDISSDGNSYQPSEDLENIPQGESEDLETEEASIINEEHVPHKMKQPMAVKGLRLRWLILEIVLSVVLLIVWILASLVGYIPEPSPAHWHLVKNTFLIANVIAYSIILIMP